MAITNPVGFLILMILIGCIMATCNGTIDSNVVLPS